jgi:hypothetical protein
MFIVFVGNSDDGYKAYANIWSTVGCKLITEPVPVDEYRKWVGENTMGAYGVYEGNGVMRFVSTTNGEIFKCYASSAIVPFANLIANNISFDDYVAEYTGDDDDDISCTPLDFSAYVNDVVGEISKWSNAF